MKVLIVGGYGTFGARLARLLAHDARLTLAIAGRSLAKAEAFCAGLDAQAGLGPVVMDRDGDVAAVLAAEAPDIVVDAAGPFQLYGRDPYRLVRACIEAGANYLDLADSADFVVGIEAFDATAKARGVFVLSGLSTFPALSSAVVQALAGDLDRIEVVRAGVAPSPWAGIGPNVVRAISSYAGKPLSILRGGRRVGAPALIDDLSRTIAPPGGVPLRPIRFSLAETPDLALAERQWPGVREVWTGAGPTPGLLHRLLSCLAWLVRLKVVPTLEPLAGLFHWGTRVFRWGEARGGMFVEVEGVSGEASVRRSWHLVAEGDDGPFIPSMGAAALIAEAASGVTPEPGARPAVHALTLTEYEAQFARFDIAAGRRDEAPAGGEPLYRRILGGAWDRLPEAVRAMHDLDGQMTAAGEGAVERGRHPLARLVGGLIGLPPAADRVPVTVRFTERDGVERWTRTFGRSSFASTQEEGRGPFGRLVVERFGPVALGLALVAEEDRVRLHIRRVSVFGVPLPASLWPRLDTVESVDPVGRFRFDDRVTLPLAGLLVRYRGWLVPARQPVELRNRK